MIQRLTAAHIRRFLPARRANSRKGQNGKVLVVGGGRIYHGAPALASMAALRSGVDLAYAAVPKTVVDAVRAASCDIIVIPMADQKLTRGAAAKLAGTIPKGLDSAAIGMGLDATDGLPTLVGRLTDMDVRLVLDAGALVPGMAEMLRDRNCVLTPHAGEFYRLFGESPPDGTAERAQMVRRVAGEYGVTILLKGETDIVSDGSSAYANPGRVPAMTAGGTGDVLCGLAAGILARNRNPLEAAASAAYINKRAGLAVQKETGLHMVASDIIPMIPSAMRPFDRVAP